MRKYIKQDQKSGNNEDFEIWKFNANFLKSSDSEFEEEENEKKMEQTFDTTNNSDETRKKASNQGKQDMDTQKLEEESSILDETISLEELFEKDQQIMLPEKKKNNIKVILPTMEETPKAKNKSNTIDNENEENTNISPQNDRPKK